MSRQKAALLKLVMKKIVLLSLLAFISCGEYRAIMSEETKNYKDAKIYFADSKQDILDVSLNNVKHRLLFDTGAGATLLYTPKFLINTNKKIRKRNIYGFDKKIKTEAYNYSLDSLKTAAFMIKNKYLFIKENVETSCSDSLLYDGILGNFVDSEYLLELNYEEGYIQFVDHLEKEEYIEIDAKFNTYTGKFTVNLEVDGITDNFLFDTGNKSVTLLNKNVFLKPGEKMYTIESINFAVGNLQVPIKVDIYQKIFNLNGQLKFDFPVGIDTSSERSVLNKNFIEKFNWFIDAKNAKVYCKPIDAQKLMSKKEIKKSNILRSAIRDEKLVISYKNYDAPYELGSEIISINDQKIDSKNICDMRDFLNSTADWKILKIEIL
jgi:hypothetical protein